MVAIFLGLWSVSSLSGQIRVFAEYGGGVYPVEDMNAGDPVIVVNGQRMTIPGARMLKNNVSSFTDGSITINRIDARMGQNYWIGSGQFIFAWEAEVQADRDFERCYMLFIIQPKEGTPTYRLHEIKDVDAGSRRRIQVSVPVNPGFGGGAYDYHIFSGNEEIQVIDRSKGRRVIESRGKKSTPAPADTPPRRKYVPPSEVAKVTDAVMPNYPKRLEGSGKSGMAQLTYTLDEFGAVVEIVSMAADDPAFLSEARDAVVKSSYQPSIDNGKPLVTTVAQYFSFNEFVCFAEGIEVVLYPNIDDRNAKAIYTPIPEYAPSLHGENGFVELEFIVDPLGRVDSPAVLQASSDSLAAATLDLLPTWVFLPRVSGGEVVSYRAKLPVRFAE